MLAFRPTSAFYDWRPHDQPVLAMRQVQVLEIGNIRCLRRRRQCGDFDRIRMLRILRGLAEGDRLPPIEVYPLFDNAQFTHQLYDGFHRFCAAISAGFSAIPTVLNGEWLLER